VLWEAVYINPRSSTRSDAKNSQIFSHMQHDVSEAQSESQHMILVGDFNAHLDNLPDHLFPEGHVDMLFRFPELDTTRLGCVVFFGGGAVQRPSNKASRGTLR
jgi:hypothetical protein